MNPVAKSTSGMAGNKAVGSEDEPNKKKQASGGSKGEGTGLY